MDISLLLPAFIALPLAGALLVTLLQRWTKTAAPVLGTAVTAALFALSLLVVRNASTAAAAQAGSSFLGSGMYLIADALSGIMLVIINTVALAATVYSWSYIRQYTDPWKYYALFLLMTAGLNGVVLTGDVFTLYVFLEIAALASYTLVAFGCGEEELEASFKYLVLGTLGSTLILLGIGLLYSMTSALSFSALASAYAGHTGVLSKFIVILFVAGFGLKAALVPFHAWLPDAHTSAPAPISAMLSGIVIKTLGVYALARLLFHIIGMTPAISALVLFLAALSIIVGVFLAIYQWDFKRLLAYSSVSQIGYIMLGLGLGTPLGILGGLFHMINHAFFKPLLFMNAGAVEYATETRDLKKMGGLRERMPVTANTSLIASLSISGIPPFSGFWSKLVIIVACIRADQPALAAIAALGSIVTLAYFLKAQRYAFFGPLNTAWQRVREVPAPMLAAMIFMTVLCLLSALLILPRFSGEFLQPAVQSLMAGIKYGKTLTP